MARRTAVQVGRPEDLDQIVRGVAEPDGACRRAGRRPQRAACGKGVTSTRVKGSADASKAGWAQHAAIGKADTHPEPGGVRAMLWERVTPPGVVSRTCEDGLASDRQPALGEGVAGVRVDVEDDVVVVVPHPEAAGRSAGALQKQGLRGAGTQGAIYKSPAPLSS